LHTSTQASAEWITGACSGTTIATVTITGILWEGRKRSNSQGMNRWPRGSMKKYKSFGEKKMKNAKVTKKMPRRVTVASGNVEAFVERSLERARKLDRGERLPCEITMTFEDPTDLLRVLSAQRVRVLHAVRARATPVSELAGTLRRDRKAVRRDVSLLESFGLVKTREEPNPGHGRRRVVESHAAKYHLLATI
jgi:predicted transcriptional regulator